MTSTAKITAQWRFSAPSNDIGDDNTANGTGALESIHRAGLTRPSGLMRSAIASTVTTMSLSVAMPLRAYVGGDRHVAFGTGAGRSIIGPEENSGSDNVLLGSDAGETGIEGSRHVLLARFILAIMSRSPTMVLPSSRRHERERHLLYREYFR